MAIKFLQIFSRTDAKSRVFIVIATVVGIGGLIYVGSHFLSGGGGPIGTAKVANAPSDLQSVPGGQLTPEYSRALAQENAQAAQRAQSSGGSAVATLVNVDQTPPPAPTGSSCTIVCPGGEAADVTDDINNLVKSGKLPQADANKLLAMAKDNVPVSQYADELDELVKEGKLTPEQARKLLQEYTNQHANALAAKSAQTMDALIKSGALPLAVANELMDLQKKGVSPAEYQAELDRLVREGKISPATAAALLAQYTQQKNDEATAEGVAGLQDLVKSGAITQDVADDLAKLQKRNVPVSEYQAELNRLVAEGKITPAEAAKLLAQYQAQRTAGVPASVLSGLGGDATASDLNDMLKSGRISPDTANILASLQARHVSPQEYQKELDELVREGKISPEDAKKLMADYAQSDAGNLGDLVSSGKISAATADEIAALQKQNLTPEQYQQALEELVKEGKISPEVAKELMARYQNSAAKRGELQKLMAMQANNVSPAEYSAELTRAVQEGLITPEMAARLQAEYNAATASPVTYAPPPSGTTAGIESNVPSDQAFARLQERLRAQQAQQQQQPVVGAAPVDNSQQFSDAAAQAAAQAAAAAEQAREQRIQNLIAAMSGQAKSLISSWQPPTMSHKGNSAPPDESEKSTKGKTSGGGSGGGGLLPGESSASSASAPVIKAGTIYFAVLDTAIDSDFPDTPILATIVAGPYKGAKLLGQVTVNSNAVTQSPDRVSLSFISMSVDAWPSSQSITAFAIDPQTARTVMASNVDYHYLKRYGAMMGSAFLSGYASAISNAGATTSTGIFGTTTTHPELSAASKLAVGLGQVGTTLGTATANYINTPPTVKVNAGVGLGVLFMSDVTITAAGTTAGAPTLAGAPSSHSTPSVSSTTTTTVK